MEINVCYSRLFSYDENQRNYLELFYGGMALGGKKNKKTAKTTEEGLKGLFYWWLHFLIC
jgi:hypothetical protein